MKCLLKIAIFSQKADINVLMMKIVLNRLEFMKNQ